MSAGSELGQTIRGGQLASALEVPTIPASGAAPADSQYWVGAADATLTNEKNLGALANGIVVNTAGVPSINSFTTNRIPFGSGVSSGLTDSSELTWNPTTKIFSVSASDSGSTVNINVVNSSANASSGAGFNIVTVNGNAVGAYTAGAASWSTGVLISTGKYALSPGLLGTGSAVEISSAGLFTFLDGANFELGTTTGTKIGTSTSQKLSVYNSTPIVQGAAVTDASGGTIIDSQARTAINDLLARIRAFGIIAT